MVINRPKPITTEDESQTDIQCYPFYLTKSEIAFVHSNRLVQTELSIDPQELNENIFEILKHLPSYYILRDASSFIPIHKKKDISFKLRTTIFDENEYMNHQLLKFDLENESTETLPEELVLAEHHSPSSNPDSSTKGLLKSRFKISLIYADIDNLPDDTGKIFTLKGKTLCYQEAQTDLSVKPFTDEDDDEEVFVTNNKSVQTSVTFIPDESNRAVLRKLNICTRDADIKKLLEKIGKEA